MTSENDPINEYIAAKKALIAVARHTSGALPMFSKWLMAGFGAAFGLALVNMDTVTKFIGIAYIRYGLFFFLLSLAIIVAGTYLGTIITMAIAAEADGEAIGKQIIESKQKFDIDLFISEYERGLIPPIRQLAHATMEKVRKGDIVAGARMIAKLSQIQSLIVLLQGLLAVIAVGFLVYGLRAH